MTIIAATGLTYSWPGAAAPVLDVPALDIAQGERVLLRGPSGSGKTTLLAAIAGAVDVGPGMLRVCGTDIGALRGSARDQFRVENVGIVYQLFNLVPYLSAMDNVVLPCRFSQKRRQAAGDARREARRLLGAMGVSDERLLNAPSADLSVGQQQRVAAARALIGRPPLVLADEPTSALDPETRDIFLDLLLSECRSARATLLCVSHDPALDTRFDRVLELSAFNAAAEATPC